MLYRIFLSMCCITVLSFPASATMHPSERMTDSSLEIRAQALYKDLRCITCDGQSVAGSQSDMAFAIRSLVREQLTDGANNNEILSYLQDRYGDQILMQPPFKPATWLLWLLPIIVLTSGSLFVFQTFRNKT